jgi:hypothetical protein
LSALAYVCASLCNTGTYSSQGHCTRILLNELLPASRVQQFIDRRQKPKLFLVNVHKPSSISKTNAANKT